MQKHWRECLEVYFLFVLFRYYSASIIRMSGVKDESMAIWISAGVAAVNFVCTFIGLFLVDRAGRRKLTLISYLGL